MDRDAHALGSIQWKTYFRISHTSIIKGKASMRKASNMSNEFGRPVVCRYRDHFLHDAQLERVPRRFAYSSPAGKGKGAQAKKIAPPRRLISRTDI